MIWRVQHETGKGPNQAKPAIDAQLHGPLQASQRRENEEIPKVFGDERLSVSAISSEIAAGSFAMSISEAADKASNGGREVYPAGSWQQAAGLFSAIADMLSSDLTTHGTGRQNRSDLIQKLDELETTLRNGSSDDNDSLKVALARLEAELRAWSGMPSESEPSSRLQPSRATGRTGLGGHRNT